MKILVAIAVVIMTVGCQSSDKHNMRHSATKIDANSKIKQSNKPHSKEYEIGQNKNEKALNDNDMTDQNKYPVVKSEKQWREELGEERYRILRQKGTEYPGTGKYNLHFSKGTYACGGCNAPLFASDNKFESNCGWPSFDEAIEGSIEYVKDTSLGMIRTEVLCAKCGGHLGHVCEDGPKETTGQRYCINSLAIDFIDEE